MVHIVAAMPPVGMSEERDRQCTPAGAENPFLEFTQSDTMEFNIHHCHEDNLSNRWAQSYEPDSSNHV